jgi:hypothetical protein
MPKSDKTVLPLHWGKQRLDLVFPVGFVNSVAHNRLRKATDENGFSGPGYWNALKTIHHGAAQGGM